MVEQRPVLSPRRALADMAGATVYLGVPAIYRVATEAPVSTPPDLRPCRYLLSCTAPLSPDLIRRFAARFGAAICQHYGSSETGAVANHSPDRVLERPDSVGRVIRGVSVHVAQDTGELVVEGPAVATGYALGSPGGATPLAGGSFRTGDLAEIDSEGFIRIHGRRDAVINVGGLEGLAAGGVRGARAASGRAAGGGRRRARRMRRRAGSGGRRTRSHRAGHRADRALQWRARGAQGPAPHRRL